jgi:hypothetical protein
MASKHPLPADFGGPDEALALLHHRLSRFLSSIFGGIRRAIHATRALIAIVHQYCETLLIRRRIRNLTI